MTLPSNETELTPEWLTQTLRQSGALERGRVTQARPTRIAEGAGLMARLFRVELDYEGAGSVAPRSLIAKTPMDVPQNRQVADFWRMYQRECDFYQHYAGRSPLRVPKTYGIAREGTSDFVLLLEDLGKYRLGDQVLGNRAEDGVAAITALAAHHATFWGEARDLPHLLDYSLPEFAAALDHTYRGSVQPTIDAFPEHFTPVLRELALALTDKTTALLRAELDKPRTILHGDFRSDNLFYGLPDAPVAIVDWQISGRGYGPFDVAYHLTQSVTPAVRRAIERPALEGYLRVLQEHGVKDLSFSDLWESYRFNALFSFVYPVTICGSLDLSNPRLRALGEMMITRSLSALADLNAGDKLPR
ncbi:MAG TPA: phosphotransferase [Polyangiales bacterium]|nr:phosphotransferase [Polyangiales bacterium]